MAENAAVVGYFAIEDLVDPYNLLLPLTGAWARCMREILDSKASPQLPPPRKQASFTETDIFGATNATHAPKVISDLPCPPLPGSANLLAASVREAKTAIPPYMLLTTPNLLDAP